MLDSSPKSIARRLTEAMKRSGVSVAQLADHENVSVQAVYGWRKTGKIDKERFSSIAKCVNETPSWLLTGESSEEALEDRPVFSRGSSTDLSEGPETRGFVPLISWVQAGSWNEAIDLHEPGDAEEFLPCPASHGMHTYALRVEGDSMTAPHGPSFPAGSVIFIDPSQRGGVVNGDKVIAKFNGENQVTFKVFVEDAGRRFLKPLNPAYPIITDEFRILGKVIGMWMPV